MSLFSLAAPSEAAFHAILRDCGATLIPLTPDSTPDIIPIPTPDSPPDTTPNTTLPSRDAAIVRLHDRTVIIGNTPPAVRHEQLKAMALANGETVKVFCDRVVNMTAAERRKVLHEFYMAKYPGLVKKDMGKV